MKKIKITFLFNQLMTPTLCTGGDVRGQIIADFFQNDKKFDVEVVLPEVSLSSFSNFKKIIIGHQYREKRINNQTLVSAFVLFFLRTIETLYHQSIFKTDILYSTGDFFCNTIPSFVIKILRPKTKFVVCIHHVNSNPFKRKSNFLIANIISYSVQRFSFFLIKQKADLIFVVNQQVKDYLVKKGFSQPVIITGNGLNIKEIELQTKSVSSIKAINHIGYFGRLSPTKGSLDLPLILSEVIKKYPKTHLDLIGIALPEIKKPLIQKFKQLGCSDHYTIHDFVKDKTDVFKILAKSKVIVFPSYEEGWGISLFESIMIKRPVVAYDLPIFKEIFNKKLKTAPIGNTKIMSEEIISFIKNYDSSSTKEYIKNCYSVAKKYDWENVFSQEKEAINNLF